MFGTATKAILRQASAVGNRFSFEETPMLKLRNIATLLAAIGMLVAVCTKAQAETKTPVVQVSLAKTTSGDCAATAPAKECKTYKPCVSYVGCCDCCGPKASQVLKVKDPCDCCCCELAEIPVCLPACCKNPCISCKCGLLGRGVVTYSYDCCCVTIVFKRCGDVVVKYN
jgi:hypothetical protein